MTTQTRRLQMRALGLVVCVACCVGIFVACRVGVGGHVDRRNAPEGGATVPQESFVEIVGGPRQDIGTLRKGERRTHTFEVRNRCGSTLAVKSVKASCTCMGPRTTKKTVEPGETIGVVVEVAGKSPSRQVNTPNAVSVTFEDHSPVLIEFVYKVIEDVHISVDEVKAGAVQRKDRLRGSIVLRPLEQGDFTILQSRSERGLVSVTEVQNVDGALRCEYQVSEMPPGPYEDVLVIETSAKIDKEIRVPFSWEVVPNIAVIPRTIFWGNLKPGSTKECELKLRSTDGTPFRVLSVQADEAALQVNAVAGDREPCREAVYRVVFTPGDTGPNMAALRAPIKIVTDKGELQIATFGSMFQ